MKFNDMLMKAVTVNLENNSIPMLLGEPGIGKSSWVEALAELNHTKCFTLACNQLADKADLTGARLVPTAAGDDYQQVFYPHADISNAIAYANNNPRENPILFLDELNRTTPDVTSELLSLPTARRIGGKSLPKNLKIIIAGNDKGNVTALDTASISRFVLYHVEPDIQTFFNVNPDLNQWVKEVLNEHPDCLFNIGAMLVGGKADDDDDENQNTDLFIEDVIDDAEDMRQIATPRTITAVSNFLNGLDIDTIKEMIADTRIVEGETVSAMEEILEGHTGSTNFTKFLFLKVIAGVNINSTSGMTATAKPGKPKVYDELKNKALTTRDELIDFVQKLNNKDKSGCLVYALYEAEDNALIITVLSENIAGFESNDVATLQKLNIADAFDKDNLTAWLRSNTAISNKFAMLFEE
jgi:energy-coupling factor transporter ATP-binding protein EcfA2